MAGPTEIVIPIAMAIQFGAACFMAGQFAQRLKRVEDENKDRAAFHEKVTRLDEQMSSVKTTVDSVGRAVDGIHRQLGNLMLKGTGDILSG
jgi:hypothetical protein